MDRRVDVRHFVHRRSCDISSSNMAAYERWPRVNGRGTKYSSEVCRMGHALEEGQGHFSSIVCQYVNIPGPRSCMFLMLGSKCMFLMIGYLTEE